MKRPQATPTTSTDSTPPDLFGALRQMLLRHRDGLLVVHDTDQHFYANCRTPGANGKAQFFGAVKVSGRKHAFHLMPIYDHPDLLAGISPALKQRMQGKSCFNFDRWDEPLLQELQALVDQGAAQYASEGRV